MLEIIWKKFQDPNAPLLGPSIKGLRITGLLLPKSNLLRAICFFGHFTEIFFGVTEYIDIWYVRSNLALLLNNLKSSMMAAVGIPKVVTFLLWQKYWKEILYYCTQADIENRKNTDERNIKIITRITKHCHGVTSLYYTFAFATVVSIILTPVAKYILSPTYRENTRNGDEEYFEVLNSWVPFDKSTLPGYLGASFFQSYAAVVAGLWLAGFDSNAVAIMVFFKGEIEQLRLYSSKIFGSEGSSINEEEVKTRIKACHDRHNAMLKYAALFNSCLSPLMLMYVIVSSIMLCVTGYQILLESNLMPRILIAQYLTFGLMQLFLYCWHSNDVYHASQDLYLGPYESLWRRDVAYRKDVLLLMIQFQKIMVFTAGPFAYLSMATFTSILKGAYSYYTILSSSYGET